MESLKLRLQALSSASLRLQQMLKKLEHARMHQDTIDADDLLAYRDSVIKRFEISYDLFWKSIKEYLQNKYSVDLASPKKIFQECFKLLLVSEEETRKLLDMVDDRNSTTHIYDEETAEEISQRISDYYLLIQSIIHRLDFK